MNPRELKALKKLLDEHTAAAVSALEDVDLWKEWPNTLPRGILKDIDQLVQLHEFEWRSVLGLYDLCIIIAQRAYDRAARDLGKP